MNRIPVDVSAFGSVLAADATAQPVKAYENGAATGQQAADANGVPLWRASVLFRTDAGVETVAVKFPARIAPTFTVLDPVNITGLTVFASSDGKTYFAADALAPVTATKGAQS